MDLKKLVNNKGVITALLALIIAIAAAFNLDLSSFFGGAATQPVETEITNTVGVAPAE